jgi:iron complex outermembrane receptor protein
VWKARKDTSYKLIYGRAFRNPSTFERYYEPNPLLEAEKMNSFEVAREQRIFNRVDLVASVFHYRINGLVEGVLIDSNTLQYRNVAGSRATGFELEASGHPTNWLETSASVSFQRTKYTNSNADIPNSPVRLAQFRASVPLVRSRLIVSGATRYLSARLSPYGYYLDPVVLADVTATTSRLHRNFDLQFGVRNIANRRYVHPLSAEHLIEVLPGAGRSAFLKLIWRYGD